MYRGSGLWLKEYEGDLAGCNPLGSFGQDRALSSHFPGFVRPKSDKPRPFAWVRLAKTVPPRTHSGPFGQNRVLSSPLLGFVPPRSGAQFAPVGFVWLKSRAYFEPPASFAKVAVGACAARVRSARSRAEFALSWFDGIHGGCSGSFGQNSAYKNRLPRRRRRRAPFQCRLYEPSLPIGVFISFLPPISRSQTQPSEEEIGALCKQQEIYSDFFILGLNE
jgi:hypothetical protein